MTGGSVDCINTGSGGSANHMVETLWLELPAPGLDDNAGDLDRLVRALKPGGYDPLRIRPSVMRQGLKAIRQGDFKCWATVGYDGLCWELLEVLPGPDQPDVLGFAVDLGSTGIAVYLIDFANGMILDRNSVKNPQSVHGEDILTRIHFARNQAGIDELQRLAVEAINSAMRELLENRRISTARTFALAIAGNTTMIHFLLGLDTSNICREPYIPAANRFPVHRGCDLGLDMHSSGLVHLFPNVGSYFGGDLISGILASGLHKSGETGILVDVGTNAEVVLGNREWLIACAGAAGPALEGGVLERGMPALTGAIDRVRIDPDTLEPSWTVIGGGKPAGICGSGVIDCVAEMFQAGLLTVQGRINKNLESERVVTAEEAPAYVLAKASETADCADLLVSELDIRIFLKSKAAMYTILWVITRRVGLEFGDISKFFVAGAFGNNIDPAMAVRIGMLPDLPLDRYIGLGNTSGRGAVCLLLNRDLLEEVEEIRSRITYMELNVNMELMNEFRGALFLPHTDRRLFPSVHIPEKAMT